MAVYISQADLKSIFGEEEFSDLPEGQLLNAVATAEARFNAILGRKYAMPLPLPLDAVLVNALHDMARYFVYGAGAAPWTPEKVSDIDKRYKQAIGTLEDVLNGELTIIFPESVITVTQNTARYLSRPPLAFEGFK